GTSGASALGSNLSNRAASVFALVRSPCASIPGKSAILCGLLRTDRVPYISRTRGSERPDLRDQRPQPSAAFSPPRQLCLGHDKSSPGRVWLREVPAGHPEPATESF